MKISVSNFSLTNIRFITSAGNKIQEKKFIVLCPCYYFCKMLVIGCLQELLKIVDYFLYFLCKCTLIPILTFKRLFLTEPCFK